MRNEISTIETFFNPQTNVKIMFTHQTFELFITYQFRVHSGLGKDILSLLTQRNDGVTDLVYR